MWFVYILLCTDNSLYTGSTNNLNKRFLSHQKGTASKYTRSHKVIKIVYQESFKTQSEALKREAQIKSWPRAQKIKNLEIKL